MLLCKLTSKLLETASGGHNMTWGFLFCGGFSVGFCCSFVCCFFKDRLHKFIYYKLLVGHKTLNF